MLQARAVLDAVTFVSVSADVCERAADLDPDTLRSLDAIHLAAALELGDELEGIITYDGRLAAAAQARGIVVFAPS